MNNQIHFCILLFLCLGLGRAFAVEKEWVKLRGCELIEHDANDGDSFHVSHEGKHYIFRLCFVDAPETSLAFPDRVKAQAKWWGVSNDDVIRGGKAATTVAKAFLEKPFTVFTKFKDARGKSTLPRHFAMVTNKDGEFLSKTLARQGLARAYGYLPDLPDGTSRWDCRKEMQSLEKDAKSGKIGVWGSAEKIVADGRATPIPALISIVAQCRRRDLGL